MYLEMMTDEEYVRTGGSRCPACKSNYIHAEESPEAEGTLVSHYIRCYDCNTTWWDTYRMYGYELDKIPNETEERLVNERGNRAVS